MHPFYKKLAQVKGNTHFVALLPQPVEEGAKYLKRLGVFVDDVKQLPLDKIGVRGTPTLLLVDRSGVVKRFWTGKLQPEQESTVLDLIEQR